MATRGLGDWAPALAGVTMFLAWVPACAEMALAPIQVTPRVYYVQGLSGIASSANEGYNSNAGFVVTEQGVVVVDALGTPAPGAALLKAIRRVTPTPVKRVVVRHY